MSLLVLLLLSGRALCAVKEWSPDTRFDNPLNWPDHRLPCGTQRAVLAGVSNLPVHLQSQIQLAGMVLPRSGELALAKGASITFHTSKTSRGLSQECLDAGDATPDAQFLAGERIHWFGPDNWLLKNSPQLHWGSVDQAVTPVAVPDAERVPCPADRVVFADRSFRVDTDELTPVVRSIEIEGKPYDSEMLSRLRTTSAGRLLVRGEIQTVDRDCTDLAGCPCGNDNPDKMERICLQRAPHCPTDLTCNDPVTPLGNCCPICGSFVVARGSGFRFGELEQLLITNALKPQCDNQVQAYVHKTYDNRVQMVFVDVHTSTGRPQAHALATELFNYLSAGEGKSRHGISSANLTGSTAWTAAAGFGALTSASGGNVGLIFGILFAIVAIAAVVVLAVFYLRRRNFTFKGHTVIPWARFDEGRVELELGTTPHEELVPTGFANPLTSSPFKQFPELESKEKLSSTFANPAFEAAEREASASS